MLKFQNLIDLDSIFFEKV